MTNVKFLFDRFFGELKAGRKPEDILDELAMMSDGKNQTERDKQNMVNLLTMHASKGLEFPYVYLPCMDDDTTPGQKNDPVEDFDALEEERRIAYVGFTRARMKLSVSYAKKKAKHGKILDVKASPWVREVSLGTNNPILKYRAAASLPSPSR
jgi:superfamily I DNA/RNA helicase